MAAVRAPSTARRLAAVTAALALVLTAAACTDEDQGASTGETVPAGGAPSEPATVSGGCGPQAVTDPANLDAKRIVARCGPGAPEPRPLTTRARLTVAVPAGPGEEQAPVLLAGKLGEFEAENLDVEIVERDTAEAMADLAAGRLDAVVGPLGGPFLDAVHARRGVRAVLGGVLSRDPDDLTTPQAGLWLRRAALSDESDLGDLSNLKGQEVAVPGGIGSAALYPVGNTLEQSASDTETVELVDLAGQEAADRLMAGELAAAWLDGSAWLSVPDDGTYALATTLPPSESIDGIAFSARLTGHDRTVGLAFARAVIRTINTHLSGDYQSNDDVVAALADATGLDEDAITETPRLLFDWELRDGTLARIEDALIKTGGVDYDAPQPPETLVDRTFATDAVGRGSG